MGQYLLLDASGRAKGDVFKNGWLPLRLSLKGKPEASHSLQGGHYGSGPDRRLDQGHSGPGAGVQGHRWGARGVQCPPSVTTGPSLNGDVVHRERPFCGPEGRH